ncbi:BnaC09g28760D [Brassica napus]|uniref:BnaC09g28760D protein n=2 Tax=Brassica TaxID=3705 RepID=A0A078GRK3_BRANA|nr:BnaC09g28760D [Brassica napus]
MLEDIKLLKELCGC